MTKDKKYKFEGRIIKLTEGDYDTWSSMYYSIPDLYAELYSLDLYYSGEEEQGRKVGNWFLRASNILNRKHQETLMRQKASENRPENNGWTTDSPKK